MRLPIGALIMICMAGIMFFLYVGFNQAFHGDNMLKDQLWESANKTITGDSKTKFDNLMPQLTQGFGIACVLCFILAIVFFVVEAFGNPPREMQ